MLILTPTLFSLLSPLHTYIHKNTGTSVLFSPCACHLTQQVTSRSALLQSDIVKLFTDIATSIDKLHIKKKTCPSITLLVTNWKK